MDTNNLDKWWYGLPENTKQAIGNDEIWENWICHPVRRYTGIPCLEFTERQKTGMRNARCSMKSRVDWATLPLSVKRHRVGGNVQRERGILR